MRTVARLEAVAEGLFGNRVTVVVVDLDLLTFCDSSCLRAFIQLRERSVARGVLFRLVKPQAQVSRAFAAAGLAELLEG
jgi:anti-anti-sigma factor